MKKIQILMSTYNGEAYLREQLDSIFGQDCENAGVAEFFLFVRDDGSTDGTQEILKEYRAKYPEKFRWVQGKNQGVIRSFFALLKHADEQMDYYACADQDDYWMPDKLSSGIRGLEGLEDGSKPNLYCCRPKLVDGNLQELVTDIRRPPVRPSFGNALVENVVTGCTVIMNQALRKMVAVQLPKFTTMHDRWLYLVAGCFGEIIYDETPHICYRQHSTNVMGFSSNRFAELKERLSRFRGRRRDISRQTAEFLRIFGDLSREDLRPYAMDRKVLANLHLAEDLVSGRHSFPKRLKIVKDRRVYRQRKNDNRIFMFLILIGSY